MDRGDVVGYAWVSLCAANGVAFAFSFGIRCDSGALPYLVAMGWHNGSFGEAAFDLSTRPVVQRLVPNLS
jgi:hypothetical protein